MNSGTLRRSSQTSQSGSTSTLAPPATTYNKQEEEIKKIIYKDAPKTSLGKEFKYSKYTFLNVELSGVTASGVNREQIFVITTPSSM